MDDILQVTLVEVSDVHLENAASTTGGFFVTLQMGDIAHTSTKKYTPHLAAFVERFEFDLNSLGSVPQLILTLHQALDSNRSIELGTAHLSIARGTHDVTLQNNKGDDVCKIQVHLGAPGQSIETTEYTVYAKSSTFTSKEFLAGYVIILLLAAAWVGGILRERSVDISSSFGPVRFKPGLILRTGDYITGCVGIDQTTCQPMFLHMQADGDLVFCKGSSPGDNQGMIWHTHTGRRTVAKDYTAQMLPDGANPCTKRHATDMEKSNCQIYAIPWHFDHVTKLL